MAEITHAQVPTNRIELHVAAAGPVDGPPVVLCHGFPELWYSWRHQLAALADAAALAYTLSVRVKAVRKPVRCAPPSIV